MKHVYVTLNSIIVFLFLHCCKDKTPVTPIDLEEQNKQECFDGFTFECTGIQGDHYLSAKVGEHDLCFSEGVNDYEQFLDSGIVINSNSTVASGSNFNMIKFGLRQKQFFLLKNSKYFYVQFISKEDKTVSEMIEENIKVGSLQMCDATNNSGFILDLCNNCLDLNGQSWWIGSPTWRHEEPDKFLNCKSIKKEETDLAFFYTIELEFEYTLPKELHGYHISNGFLKTRIEVKK
jgi:hypothetical protein